jgi:hypothetical protein
MSAIYLRFPLSISDDIKDDLISKTVVTVVLCDVNVIFWLDKTDKYQIWIGLKGISKIVGPFPRGNRGLKVNTNCVSEDDGMKIKIKNKLCQLIINAKCSLLNTQWTGWDVQMFRCKSFCFQIPPFFAAQAN